LLSYNYLFDIALILLSTKLLGLLTRRLQMPQVVGALLAGLALGPAMLNILHETEFIIQVSELGVIVLMFTAGLETDIRELKKAGKASLIIAVCGVIIPSAGGFAVAYFFNRGSLAETGADIFLQNIFIGVILAATSVSITVETLKELGKLNTKAGNAILGAALIDDILGMIALTVITSFADSSVNVLWVLAKILIFFAVAVIAGFAFYYLFTAWRKRCGRDLKRFAVVGFAFCLVLAYVGERYFGIADITGAYIAGLIISNTQSNKYIANRFETLSFLLLSPIFFASIGIKVELPDMSASIIVFSAILLIVAVVTKIVGCGLGALGCRYSKAESVQVGVGMVSRGEVALIVASKDAALGIMNMVFFGPVIITVICTTIITPILLKLVFKDKNAEAIQFIQSDLVEKYEETEQIDLAEQELLKLNEELRKPVKNT